jgi:hypothetical protein
LFIEIEAVGADQPLVQPQVTTDALGDRLAQGDELIACLRLGRGIEPLFHGAQDLSLAFDALFDVATRAIEQLEHIVDPIDLTNIAPRGL